jgi:CubicO group peptidase (beta-lactamase class C family)
MSGRPDPYARLRRRGQLAAFVAVVAVLGTTWYLWPRRAEAAGTAAAIDAVVREAMAEGPIAGLTVGVARGGRTLHLAGYGFGDLENRVPTTAETVYHVGSITKQFTAAAILQLVEEGRVDLDAPVGDYLEDLPERTRAITVRALLDHTGGVRNFTTMEPWWRTVAMDLTPRELAGIFLGEPLDFEPGTAFSYSNSGYILLGLLIERVSGRPYGGYLNEQLFQPLGLTRTSFCDQRSLTPDRARGYERAGEGFVNAQYISMTQAYAAGGLCSSAPDLLRWIRLLAGGGVIRRGSFAAMIEPARLADGRQMEYGLGLATAFTDGHRRIAHVGGMRGFSSFVALYPDDDLGIVVLTNTENAAAAAIVDRIAGIVLGIVDQEPLDLPLSSAELERYVGDYDMRLAEVSLTVRSGRLHAEIDDPGVPDADLLYQGDHTFQAAGDPGTSVRFVMDGERATGFALSHQGITIEGRRLAGPSEP